MTVARFFRLDGGRLLDLAGVAAAVFIATMLNVLVARHGARWDWTEARRYTLTEASKATLRSLPDTVHLWILAGSADPLQGSLRQLIPGYEAESRKLEAHWIDPDRDAVALEDVKKRFRIETGRTENGHVVADAVIVVSSGERRWFVAPTDLIEASDGGEGRVRPRHEQAITSAIRAVVSGERLRVCFTSGHGELSIADGSERGLGHLRLLLEKDNYEPVVVDVARPDVAEPLRDCALVVIAGPVAPFTETEEIRLRSHLLGGGSLLLAVGPIDAAGPHGVVGPGLAKVVAPFGIGLRDDLVVEGDRGRIIPESRGVQYFAEVREHPITAGLVGEREGRITPRVVLHFARSLSHVTADGAVPAVELLVTSDQAYAKASVVGESSGTGLLPRTEHDTKGPFAVAMASERGKVAPTAAHGPRVVVIGTRSPLMEPNFHDPEPLRGAATFVESAISWLAARPEILDVPPRKPVSAGLRLSEEARSAVRRYVLGYMPLAALLLGLAVGLWRRGGHGGTKAPGKKKAKARHPGSGP